MKHLGFIHVKISDENEAVLRKKSLKRGDMGLMVDEALTMFFSERRMNK